jgi:type IV secretion system protein VirD4
MTTRSACPIKRYAPLVLLLCLWAAPALALPEATINRIVDLKVQTAEIQYWIANYPPGQYNRDTFDIRTRNIDAELKTLNQQLGRLSAGDQRQANSEIDRLTKARLATLVPQWQASAAQDRKVRSLLRQRAQAKTAAEQYNQQQEAEGARDIAELGTGIGGFLTPTASTWIFFAVIGVLALLYVSFRHGPLAGRPASIWGYLWRYAAVPILCFSALVTVINHPPGWSGFFVGMTALYVTYRIFRPKPAGRSLSTVYGTAHYFPMQADIRNETCLADGLFLGKSSEPGRGKAPLDAPGAPVCSTPEHHTLIVARTRTGKGTRVIIPTLLRYAGSALVIDPKGENAAITAGVRKAQLGQSIHILNPWNELAERYQSRGFAQATYNPLDILDRNDPNVVAIAQTLAGAICPAAANAKDRFWQGSAANVLTGVFLWLADQPGEQKTLARAREIVSLTRKDFTAKYLIPMAASEAFSGAIREMAAPFIDLADETYSGVMSNLSESTKFLSDPQIKAATAKSSFAMEDLATRKTTVYVVIPTERMDTQKTWLRLVIASAMHIFKHPQTKLPFGHRCLFLIDEFAALGRLDDLPRDIATMSGFGVDFALIVQGLDQLKDHYAEARGTILSNCAYKWFCDVNDLDSAKYLSDSLGKATVGTVSTSSSSSRSGQSGSSSHTVSQSETGRSLLNPDEVLNLGRNVAIAIQPNGHPHYLRPIDYWNLTEAFAALHKKHPALYWQPPVAYDENPYFAPPPPPPGGGDGRSGGKEKARSQPPPPKPEPFMTKERAREILEVGPNASPDEIRAAYIKLIPKVHPDNGGSTYLTKEVNAAKDLLLGL